VTHGGAALFFFAAWKRTNLRSYALDASCKAVCPKTYDGFCGHWHEGQYINGMDIGIGIWYVDRVYTVSECHAKCAAGGDGHTCGSFALHTGFLHPEQVGRCVLFRAGWECSSDNNMEFAYYAMDTCKATCDTFTCSGGAPNMGKFVSCPAGGCDATTCCEACPKVHEGGCANWKEITLGLDYDSFRYEDHLTRRYYTVSQCRAQCAAASSCGGFLLHTAYYSGGELFGCRLARAGCSNDFSIEYVYYAMVTCQAT